MSKHAKHMAPKAEKQARASAPRRPAKREPEWINETQTEGRSRKNKGSGKGLKVVIVILAVIAVLLAAAYLVFTHFYSKLNFVSGMTAAERAAAIASFVDEGEDEEIPDDAVYATDQEISDMQASIQEQLARGSKMSSADVVNVLLIGTDARSMSERARSDVMMLASLNKKTNKIVLTSFMRDIYTYIPDYGYNRLNAPYAIAGADYLIDTLEADFGVDIDNYVAVNFYIFADIIDAVGGVDLSLTNSEVDFINGQAYYGEQANLGVGTGAVYLDYSSDGWYHLNGTQALAHCRNRSSAGSDFDRTDRQRTVISTMLSKAKSLSVTELTSLANTILPMVTTDLTQGDCLSLVLSSPEYLNYEIQSLRIPDVEYYGTMIDGMSVISIDFAANAQVLQNAIYN